MMTQENGSYKIPINNYTSIYQTLQNAGPIDIKISKSVHSLDRVYVSYYIEPNAGQRIPAQVAQQVHLKQYNFFYSPASFPTNIRYNSDNDIK